MHWSGIVNKKVKNIDYRGIEPELKNYRKSIRTIYGLKNASPLNKKMLLDQARNDVKRIIWYYLDMVYPN